MHNLSELLNLLKLWTYAFLFIYLFIVSISLILLSDLSVEHKNILFWHQSRSEYLTDSGLLRQKHVLGGAVRSWWSNIGRIVFNSKSLVPCSTIKTIKASLI